MNRAKLKLGGVLLGMFVLGGICGGAAMRVVKDREMSALLDAPPPEAAQRLRLRALARQLGLSEEQKARIGAILRDEREACAPAQLREQALRECRAKTRSAVDEVLTVRQRERLDQILARRAQREAGQRRP